MYRWANCTNPHPFPTGILTERISPYWEKACLRSSSLAFGSSRPTNIYKKKWVKTKTIIRSTQKRKGYFLDGMMCKDLHSLLCLSNHHQTEEHHLMHNLATITWRWLNKIKEDFSFFFCLITSRSNELVLLGIFPISHLDILRKKRMGKTINFKKLIFTF